LTQAVLREGIRNADSALLASALTLRASPEIQHVGIAKARVDEQHYRLHFEAVQ